MSDDGDPEAATGPRFPTLGGAVLLVIAAVLAMVVAVILAGIMGLEPGSDAFAASLVNLASIGGVTYVAWLRTGATARDAFPLRPLAGEPLGWMLVMLVGAGLVLSELDNYVQWLLGPPPDAFRLGGLLEGGLPAVLLLLVVVAPVTEELLFRGIILRGLAVRYGATLGIVSSATLFAAVHLNPWQMLGAFGIGIVFGWWYVSTRNLSVTLAGHAAVNGLWLVAMLAFPPIEGFTAIPDDGWARQPFELTLAGLVMLVIGTTQCRARFRARHPAPD